MVVKRKGRGCVRRAKEIDFRSPSDDAWYSVRLHKEKEGVLRVMYREFPESHDERFTCEEVESKKELDDLIGRFRVQAQQLQEDECASVREGMKVLVCYTFPEDELRFYDAIVDSVSSSEHKKPDEESEQEKTICNCKFTVTWQHGQHKGGKVTVNSKDICVIKSLPIKDPILLGFFEKARNVLEQKGKDKNSKGVQGSKCKEPCDSSQDESRPAKRAAISRNTSEGEYSRELNNSNDCFFFWVDNIQKYTTPGTIIKFLKRELNISAQVVLFPNKSSLSASIFVKTNNDMEKLTSFLFFSKNIVVSSKGRPWVVNGDCCGVNEEMKGVQMKQSEDKKEGPGLRIVTPESEAYENYKKILDLYKKFHEHLKGLKKSLKSEEKKLRPDISNESSSSDSDESISGGSQHREIIDID